MNKLAIKNWYNDAAKSSEGSYIDLHIDEVFKINKHRSDWIAKGYQLLLYVHQDLNKGGNLKVFLSLDLVNNGLPIVPRIKHLNQFRNLLTDTPPSIFLMKIDSTKHVQFVKRVHKIHLLQQPLIDVWLLTTKAEYSGYERSIYVAL